MATTTLSILEQPQLDHSQTNGLKYATDTSQIVDLDAKDSSTTCQLICDILKREGGVRIKNFLPTEHTDRIQAELKPVFEADTPGASDFFPTTTRRATALLGVSDACVEYATNPLWIDVCNALLTSTHVNWYGEEKATWVSKPILASTVGFQIPPGTRAQALHRDDGDYHATSIDSPMLGCLLAVTKSTKENGATMVIPRSHLWGMDRAPKVAEAIPVELDVGDAFFFQGNVYHGGGANTTSDSIREVIGLFMCKGYLRPEENFILGVPPEKAKRLSPQAQRLLGYGISQPAVGFYKYDDPMYVLFGIEDEETVRL